MRYMATRTRRGSVGRSHGAPCSCGRSSRVIYYIQINFTVSTMKLGFIFIFL